MKHITGFIQTAPLWKNEQFSLEQFEFPIVSLDDFNPKPIASHLRLGHQIEYICKQLLEHSERYKVIAHNIQVKKEKITIGELDFIITDSFRESIPIHIELTYKFYIIDPTISEPIHRLMGPNRNDMFFSKIEKTRDKQLPLAHTTEGEKALSRLSINHEVLEQKVCFLGQLFMPYGTESPPIRPLNPACIVGFWMRFEEFKSSKFQSYEFYLTQKHEWLHEPHLNVPWKSHFRILMDITIKLLKLRAPLIWVKKENGILEKGFVVWWS
ncbi:DUF1853 family protein [Dokdonia sp. Hel_I_53]|uniref:DUF1853 family protein n=1 Tax=Dokdonia sp. Hel_I_53 TaxID=1566287 RepID=UPI00119AAE43|nr:DUF1853 family protein [Dokdonia sp. Hel_I_53]TVZ51624.1 hypothetical protein OD90_0772 [Dokdonia sp. Hel_I_53]